MMHVLGILAALVAIGLAQFAAWWSGHARGYRDGRYDELLWWLRTERDETVQLDIPKERVRWR